VCVYVFYNDRVKDIVLPVVVPRTISSIVCIIIRPSFSFCVFSVFVFAYVVGYGLLLHCDSYVLRAFYVLPP
jgi:hypothetical protein